MLHEALLNLAFDSTQTREVRGHALWTAGQAVANFRKHGMAPPAFTLF